jgi:hypothetical protein
MKFLIYLAFIFIYCVAEDSTFSWGNNNIRYFRGEKGIDAEDCGFLVFVYFLLMNLIFEVSILML